MEKDFEGWIEMKKKLDKRIVNFHTKERQVWWCSLGMNIGTEQNGKNKNFERPVLIKKFINKNMILVIPFTSAIKHDRHHMIIAFGGDKSTSLILSQIRVISTSRLLRQIGWIPEEVFVLVGERFRDYFS